MNSRLIKLTPLFLFSVLLTACGENSTTKDEQISYSLQVKPILSDRCFQCHGPDVGSRKADLQLDIPEIAFKELKEGGFPIIPGDAENSIAYKRITSDNPDFIMPPPKSHMTIAPEEAEIIRAWIDQGAVYEKHWAYIPPIKADLPIVGQADWPISPIDNFTLAKIEAAGLTPSDKADKATLIRRAFLDLTGIIPSAEQFDKYMADDREDYFEYMVDDLLSTPQYAEHMASAWLDLARYGDTHGYQNDFARQMWPYRDWVIKSFDNNMPFDEFMTVQLAGDLMPNPTQDTLIATGFNRNTLVSSEEGIVHEEFRVEYVADKVDATSTTFLGHTVGCARCHDHKFDPVSQKDYYNMFAFFNNTKEFGIVKARSDAHPPFMNYFQEDEYLDQMNQLLSDIEKQEQDLRVIELAHFEEYKTRIEKEVAAIPEHIINELSDDGTLSYNGMETEIEQSNDTLLVPGKFGNAIRIGTQPISIYYAYAFVGKSIDVKKSDPLGISVWTRREELKAKEYVAPEAKSAEDQNEAEKNGNVYASNKPVLRKPFSLLEQMDMGKEQRGFSLRITTEDKLQFVSVSSWPKNAIDVTSKEPITNLKEWQHIYASYDGSGSATGVKFYIGGNEIETEIIKDALTSEIDNTNPLLTGWGYDSLETGSISHDVDEIRLYHKKNLSNEAIVSLSQYSSPVLTTSINGRIDGPSDGVNIPAEYMNDNQDYVTAKSNLFDLIDQKRILIEEHSQPYMIMEDYPEDFTTRPTYLLKRGSYEQPDETEILSANIPLEFGTLGDSRPRNRLGLVQWLTSDENTLTARVTVNRYWQALFGKGIVVSAENFGSQGSLPSHPKLLDWLAIEFIESGWDVKHILKTMMMSKTYQQDSSLPNISPVPDPENILLSRGASYRMSAEMIRDSVLKGSELLSPRIGGKSVKPYQPDGLWRELTTFDVYRHDEGENLYRRGLYSYWKRTLPVPSMLLFDATTRDVATPRRTSTNTPLQALVLLNDPQYVEASRVLAQNAIIKHESTEDRIKYIAKSLLSRNLSITELEGLSELQQDMMMDFGQDEEAVDGLLSIGEYKISEVGSEELASYAVVATTVMNLSEFITRR
ncbi:MAG: DUF1553 domain-containing protein [Kordiimonadaceae bacterium]|jgi:hypothetical protein|nr:DUF1553 domain-containing protein [Kordiimonadaceae bacterium]MBT6033280.1 DUF1553 domain-containing protein [Kordiimonadaceae bacterium]